MSSKVLREVFAILGLLAFAACEPETAETITFFSTASPPEASSAPLAQEATVSINAASMGASSGNLGRVSYQSDREKRVFLLPEDVADEVTTGTVLELPIQSVDFGTTSVVVPPLDSPKVVSARVYDTGMCSQIQTWDAFASTVINGTFDSIADATFVPGNGPPARAFFDDPRRGVSTLQPIFRSRSITSHEDTMRIHLPFTTSRFTGPNPVTGSTASCTNLSITLDFDLGIERVQGIRSLPPRCLASEGSSQQIIAGAYDFRGELRGDPVVTVALGPGGGCDFGLTIAKIEAELAISLSRSLPFGITQALNDALLVPAVFFGLTPKRCTCDIECIAISSGVVGEWPNPYGAASGQRHRCLTGPGPGRGTCGVQLEADRVALRPDGVEVVLAEDDSDPQVATVLRFAPRPVPEVAALCVLGRSTDSRRVDFVAPEDPPLHFDTPFATVP